MSVLEEVKRMNDGVRRFDFPVGRLAYELDAGEWAQFQKEVRGSSLYDIGDCGELKIGAITVRRKP